MRTPWSRAALALSFALGAGAGGCGTAAHEAQGAPLGDPSTPALRAATVVASNDDTISGAPGIQDESRRGRIDLTRPLVTRDGWIRSELKYDVLVTSRIGVQVSARGEVDVLDMRWSPPSAARCAGGHPAIEILLGVEGPRNSVLADDLQVHWERPVVVRGERVVTGRFQRDEDLMRAPSVVDVRLVERTGGVARELCVRVPVTGPEIAYRSTKTWSLGWRLGWRRALAFTPGSVATLGLSLGRWVGPVRIALEGVIGGHLDDYDPEPAGTGGCFLRPGPNCDDVSLGGVSLEASGLAWRGTGWALGWSLSYEALFAGIERYDPVANTKSSRHASSGGPRLGLQWLGVPSTIPGVSRSSPTTGWGLEVFVAAAHGWAGTAAGSPVTYGVALLGF